MVEEDISLTTFDNDTITKEDYRNQIIDYYISAEQEGLTQITDFTIGSEAYHLADTMASLMLETREQINTAYEQILIHTCVGEFLDDKGDMAGVHRIGSSPSTGTIRFTRTSRTNDTIIIPNNTVVTTDDAISFILDTDEDIILANGMNSVDVDIICEQDGAYTNVDPNTITIVMGSVGAYVTCTNPDACVDGCDIETDDEYRDRIILSNDSVATGSLYWYKNTALDLDYTEDVKVRKGTLITEPDIVITFKPTTYETVTRADLKEYSEDNTYESTSTGVMLKAREELIEHFLRDEYNLAGINVGYHLVEEKTVLKNSGGAEYLFGVSVKTGYTLNDLKASISAVINKYNKDMVINTEFLPSTLALLIEEVTGVNTCRLIKKTGTTYEEVTSTVNAGENEVITVDTTNLNNRIVPINFNILL